MNNEQNAQPLPSASLAQNGLLSAALSVEEGNFLIAHFMADKIEPPYYLFTWLKSQQKSGWYEIDRMQFHQSWDWLMPVVEKIENLQNELCNEYFWNKDDTKQHQDFRIFRIPEIENLHISIVEFIKWYNDNAVSVGSR